ncbi:tetratricopeptide repeat protein [Gemmata sp. JC717]|uniref:tetratricopeptide repeat protein n=1 Tax=Gemmata algarum TaxID=2975278 RepID=UPI0021BB3980|nr:tetratricopeptide repeat protein [Gemmata algarum]MDY3555614.1 tetratricopeptide repeat protein [Gemmata algarum]
MVGSPHPRRRPVGPFVRFAFGVAFSLVGSPHVRGADLGEAEKLFCTGKYAECQKLTAGEIAKGADAASWWVLKVRAETARGEYTAAGKTIEDARTRFPDDLVLHLLAHEVYRTSGREKEAAAALAAVQRQIDNRAASTPAERVALGRYLLSTGADAKEVLDRYFNPVVKNTPAYLDAHLAVAELALTKHDRALAAETLQKAPKESAGQDPRYHHLLARAFAEDDRARAMKAIAEALAINPHHADSLLFRADHLIDAEDFAGAEDVLKTVLATDPGEPRAWAYRAAITHLHEDAAGEKAAREKALARWPGNPHVEHLIGRKLSQDYRFKEGAAYQRKALEKDKQYLPAKAQLCLDLLRLGDETEGWKLAAEVFAADGYNVVAHNLVALRDQLSKFRNITADGFVLRMEEKEADLYGRQALAVLQRAKKVLCEKYGVRLDKPITVEIFPRGQDFAVRTFGMPGSEGVLGVCFGPVITVNGPAAQGTSPSSWEAIVWHEFCHTVTLHKTRNKMPRWLSEGISVYEESLENPGWGRWMTPRYREMTLGDDLIPLSRLSSAFLSPKSALHVQFAYFESALAVEFLVSRYGFDALKTALDDLGAGLSVNEALERRTGRPLAKLDSEFTDFARARAKSVAPDATWEEPDLKDEADSAAVRVWLQKHPQSFWGRQRLCRGLVREQKWAEAEKELNGLRGVYPEYAGPNNAYELLAVLYRQTARPKEEGAALEEWAKRDGDATAAHQRLIELGAAAGDWTAAARNARRWLAVNPLAPAPHRALAQAGEHLNERNEATTAYRAVLRFGVPDAASVRYRLAVLLEQSGERDAARREVLKALEEAPRFREAHELLLKLVAAAEKSPAPPRPEKNP